MTILDIFPRWMLSLLKLAAGMFLAALLGLCAFWLTVGNWNRLLQILAAVLLVAVWGWYTDVQMMAATGLWPRLNRNLHRLHWRNVEAFARYLQVHNLTLEEYARSRGISPWRLRRAIRREPPMYSRPSDEEVMERLMDMSLYYIDFLVRTEGKRGINA